MTKKVVVIGASENPERYSNMAAIKLLNNNYEVVPIGIKKGVIKGVNIITEKPLMEGVDTITLYINPERQREYYDYFLALKPKRIIFNPGTENMELKGLASEKGIETIEACTLVMLSAKTF